MCNHYSHCVCIYCVYTYEYTRICVYDKNKKKCCTILPRVKVGYGLRFEKYKIQQSIRTTISSGDRFICQRFKFTPKHCSLSNSYRFFRTKIFALRGRFENENGTRLWCFLHIKYLTTQSGLENRFIR